MAKRGKRLSKPESSLNVTPMADVSLSLLLGFLVITPIILETLSAKLPQGAGAAAGQVKQDPVIELTAQSEILFDGKEITREELPAKLDEHFPQKYLERKVMFTGSGEVLYEDVVDLLDLLKGLGVATIGIR
jgi:biopolymer transport protein ExbD/biopolymer transport protein TolR